MSILSEDHAAAAASRGRNRRRLKRMRRCFSCNGYNLDASTHHHGGRPSLLSVTDFCHAPAVSPSNGGPPPACDGDGDGRHAVKGPGDGGLEGRPLAEVRRELFLMTSRVVKAELEAQAMESRAVKAEAEALFWKGQCAAMAAAADDSSSTERVVTDTSEASDDGGGDELPVATVPPAEVTVTSQPVAAAVAVLQQITEEPAGAVKAAETETAGAAPACEEVVASPADMDTGGPSSSPPSPLPRSVSDAGLLGSAAAATGCDLTANGRPHARRMTDPFPGLRLKKRNKPLRKGGATKSAMKLLKMVGCAEKCFSPSDLSQHPSLPTPGFGRPGAPCILLVLREAFENSGGMRAEGALRKSPEADECAQVQRQLENGSFTFRGGQKKDPHVYAHLVKYWLRLLTPKLLAGLPDDAVRQAARRKVADIDEFMEGLGLSNSISCVLNWLMDFIAEVAENEKETRMGPEALAIVVAPNIFDIGDPFAVQYAIRTTELLIRSALLRRSLLSATDSP